MRSYSPPPAVLIPRAEQDLIVQHRRYELITPLFGGGAEPRESDLDMVVRGSEIRGQLRFWWRACRGKAYASLQALKAREDQLWGGIGTGEGQKPQASAITI